MGASIYIRRIYLHCNGDYCSRTSTGDKTKVLFEPCTLTSLTDQDQWGKCDSYTLTAVIGPATFFLTIAICPCKSRSDCHYQSGHLKNSHILNKLICQPKTIACLELGPHLLKGHINTNPDTFETAFFVQKLTFHPHVTSESALENYIFLKLLFRVVKAPVHMNLGIKICGFQNVWIRVNRAKFSEVVVFLSNILFISGSL